MNMGKQYLINFLVTMTGDKITAKRFKMFEAQIKGTGKTMVATGKQAQTMGNWFSTIAKRALLTIPAWLLLRRIFMGIFGTIDHVTTKNMELADAMARIKTVVSASSKHIERDMAIIEEVISRVAVTTRRDIGELAEVFYYLRTANLTTAEAISAFEPTVATLVGTMGDAKTVTRAVAGIYNTMGENLGKNLSTYEKFQKINDVLTYTYACYTPDTEVLTDKGWKLFTELDRTEKVATLNPNTHELEYQKPIKYVNKDFEGKLLHLKGRFVDIKVTPLHKLYAKIGYKTKNKAYKRVRAEEVYRKPKTFYRGSNWNGKNPEYFVLPEIDNHQLDGKSKRIPIKTWLKFLAWYLSEGTYMWKEGIDPTYKIQIYQSRKSKYWDKLKKIMEEMPFNYSEFNRGFIIHSKQLTSYLKQFGKSYEKFIPDFVKKLSKDLIRLFLKTYTYGDGSFRKKSFVIITSSKTMRNDLQELGLKADYGTTYKIRNGKVKNICGITTKKKTRNCWGISFSDRTEILISQEKNEYYAKKQNRKTTSKEEWIDYKGKVVCVEVPNHTLFVRRKGKAFWCGNTQDVQIDELASSYTKLAPYLTGLSDSFTDIVTMLGFLNTRMLRAGRTGRLLGRTILQLTKNADKLRKSFGVVFDPDAPISLLDTIEQINISLATQGDITSKQSEMLREVFGTRGLVPMRLMLASYNDMIEAIDEANIKAEGYAEKMRLIREATAKAQIGRFKNLLVVLSKDFASATGNAGDFVEMLTKMNDNLEISRDSVSSYGTTIGWLFDSINRGIAPLTAGWAQLMDILTFNFQDVMPHGAWGISQFMGLKNLGDYAYDLEEKRLETQRKRQKEESIRLRMQTKEVELQEQLTEAERDTEKMLKHQSNLMKNLGASSLAVSKYEYEKLKLIYQETGAREDLNNMTKARNKLLEEQAKSQQKLVEQAEKLISKYVTANKERREELETLAKLRQLSPAEMGGVWSRLWDENELSLVLDNLEYFTSEQQKAIYEIARAKFPHFAELIDEPFGKEAIDEFSSYWKEQGYDKGQEFWNKWEELGIKAINNVFGESWDRVLEDFKVFVTGISEVTASQQNYREMLEQIKQKESYATAFGSPLDRYHSKRQHWTYQSKMAGVPNVQTGFGKQIAPINVAVSVDGASKDLANAISEKIKSELIADKNFTESLVKSNRDLIIRNLKW